MARILRQIRMLTPIGDTLMSTNVSSIGIQAIASTIKDDIVTMQSSAAAPIDVMTAAEVQSWLEGLASQLEHGRNEKHSVHFWITMRDILISRRYTHGYARVAHEWILCGTRYPQARPTIVPDFFPTADQLASINADVIQRKDVRDIVRNAEIRAYAQGKRDALDSIEQSPYDHDAEHIALLQKLAHAKFLIAEQQETITRLTNRLKSQHDG